MKIEVFKNGMKEVLIVLDRDDTMEMQIPCTDLEAVELMWKIHEVMGGNGTITRD